MAIMENADFDAIVIGGGFYGSIISIYLSQYKKLKRILAGTHA
jgi:L-2-hydroxyglutarate oxidase LhgO